MSIRPVLAVAASLLLTACATSPTPSLYVLQSIPGATEATRPVSVELRRIALAGYLDRPEMVRGPRDFRLVIDDQSRWGEPLGAMLNRVLTEDLVQRLPAASVFDESGAISTKPDMVLELDVQRLDTEEDGSLILLAQLALRPLDGTAKATTLRLRQHVTGEGAASQAQAMSAALGALADEIAGRVQ